MNTEHKQSFYVLLSTLWSIHSTSGMQYKHNMKTHRLTLSCISERDGQQGIAGLKYHCYVYMYDGINKCINAYIGHSPAN